MCISIRFEATCYYFKDSLKGLNFCVIELLKQKASIPLNIFSLRHCYILIKLYNRMIISMNFSLFFLCSLYAMEDIRMRPFSIYPPLGSHILFLGRLCMPATSVCFRTPRLSLGHPGSLMSVHDLICMHTQRAPLFNVPCRRLGSTTRAVRPYPYGTSRVRNQTRVVVGEVQSIIHCTTGPAFIHE